MRVPQKGRPRFAEKRARPDTVLPRLRHGVTDDHFPSRILDGLCYHGGSHAAGDTLCRAHRGRSFGLQQDKDRHADESQWANLPGDDRRRRHQVARPDRRISGKRGIQVTVEHRGDDALARASSASNPHLVVLDVMLPGTDGFDICRELRPADPTFRS